MRTARASALVAAALLAACGASTRAPKPAPAPLRPSVVQSNILRADYAGSAACEPCHTDISEAWMRSPMHQMTRLPKEAVIDAPFNGTTFRFKDDSATLETVDGERYVTIRSKRFGDGIYRVSKVIGGRIREDFAGVRVSVAGKHGMPTGDPSEESVLPISYMKGTHKLRYKGYSVMVKERPALHAGPVWNQTCIFCHNTTPYFSILGGSIAKAGTGAYQGEVVDRLLPEERRWNVRVADSGAFKNAVREELGVLGAPSEETTAEGLVRATRDRFRVSHLVEIGIGCEVCHGGSKEHVAQASNLPSFEPRASFLQLESNHQRTKSQQINRACARCHQVLFSGYEFTWEGASRRGMEPGGSNMNSGEARDFLLGECKGDFSCTDCHSVHPGKSAPTREEMHTVAGNRLCTRCHTQLVEKGDVERHTHHRAEGDGSVCISCHMPKKNMSLDNQLSTYHRIGSPTDPKKVLLDRPIECAVCHGDKSVGALVGKMEEWWNKSYERASLEKRYGSLEANVLTATLANGKPHEQAVALYLLGKEKRASATDEIRKSLTHAYPIVRFYAKGALEEISGHSIEIDLDREP